MKETLICCHNHMIDCSNHKCEKCGWNPEVNADRIERMKEKFLRGTPLKKGNKQRR